MCRIRLNPSRPLDMGRLVLEALDDGSKRWIDECAAIGKNKSGHRLIALIYPLHNVCRFRMLFDIDFNELNPRAVELGFKSLAVSAPWRAVHRKWCVGRQVLSLYMEVATPAIRKTPSASRKFHFATFVNLRRQD